MSKFKVGDRVVGVRNKDIWILEGETGVVKSNGSSPLVQLDDFRLGPVPFQVSESCIAHLEVFKSPLYQALK